MNKLLILSADACEYARLVAAAQLPNLEVTTANDIESGLVKAPDCNIILGNPRLVSGVLQSAVNLQWVQSSWAGVNDLCRPGLRRDYRLTGVKDVFGPLISEYVITYLFAHERRVFTMRSNQLERCWSPLPYRPARDISLGIVGLGSIGRHLARTARQFGLRVTGLNRSGSACDDVEKVYTAENIEEFLAEPDYVVLVLPDTLATRDFIKADTLRMMKSTAVLMNVGRGSSVREADLVWALQQGLIGGAVLDVFAQEPLAPDSLLWGLPNVFVTPHNAATSIPGDIVGIFAENFRRFLQNEPLPHVVDFELGY